MSKLVTIFGGSGFVGRYIARRMAAQGWRVRVAVRRPNEALFVKPYGAVGQVEPVLCNIRDDASVAAALAGADAAVNCVGVLAEHGKNTFDGVQAEGAARVARLAAAAGVERLVHLSAIGADAASDSAYQQSKAKGEAGVLEHMPNAMILRPSVIFGVEDGFINRFAGMVRMGPALPVVAAETRFQPVWVDDVAQAAVQGITGAAAPGIYELGGPDVTQMREIIDMILAETRRTRVVMNVPHWAAWLMAFDFDLLETVSFGLIPNTLLTRDQLRNLQNDNVVTEGAQGFEALGIAPVAMAAVVPDYLWRYRPTGQYDAIKESADNLRS